MTIEESAEDAFQKTERVRMLEMMNTPTDYLERKKAFVELTVARRDAAEAEAALLRNIRAKGPCGEKMLTQAETERKARIDRLRRLIEVLRHNAHEGHAPYITDAIELITDLLAHGERGLEC